jgi:hypothetical protein
MKVYEEKIYKRQEVVKRECDLCGKVSFGDEREWDRGSWDVNCTIISIKIEQREGYSYPEGGSGELYNIDLCPNCFKDKLIPFLISQGAKIKQEDWDS